MKAVGIDLGTTNSIVAVVDGGQMRAIQGEDGLSLVPSVVRYQEGLSPIVGATAKSQLINDPRNILSSVKRLLGRGIEDLREDETVRYKLDQDGTVLRCDMQKQNYGKPESKRRKRNIAFNGDKGPSGIAGKHYAKLITPTTPAEVVVAANGRLVSMVRLPSK